MTNPLLPGWAPHHPKKTVQTEAVSRRPFEILFLAMLVVANVYNFYRYAFQINSRLTSPTYADTPLWLQGGKYAFVLIYLAAVFLTLLIQRRPVQFHGERASFKFFLISLVSLMLVAAVLTTYALACGLPLFQAAALTHFFFIPVLLTMPLFLHSYETSRKVQWWLVFFGLGYHAIYEAIQISLYYINGRLPALAYKHSLIRFGAGWDDPNGVAAYMALVIVVLLATGWKHRIYQLLALTAAIWIVIASKSFSGILTVALTVMVYCLLRNKVLSMVFGCLVIVTMVMSYTPLQNSIHQLWLLKEASSMSRITHNTFTFFAQTATPTSIVFGQSHRTWNALTRSNEDSYLELIISFGVPFVICFIGLLVWTLCVGWAKMRTCRRHKARRAEALFAAWISFVLAVAISCNFVPFLAVFPVNFFFWVVIMLIWMTPIPVVPAVP